MSDLNTTALHVTKRFLVLLETALTVHRHRDGHEEGEAGDGSLMGVLGPEHESPHDEVKRHGNETREYGGQSPRGHDRGHTLEVRKHFGLLVPYDAVGATVGDGHTNDTAHGGVGSRHWELEE